MKSWIGMLCLVISGIVAGCAAQSTSQPERAALTKPLAETETPQTEAVGTNKHSQVLEKLDAYLHVSAKKPVDADAVDVNAAPLPEAVAPAELQPAVAFQARITPDSPPRRVVPTADQTASVGLSFDNADIFDVTKVVSEITGKSFILDEGVKGTVTMFSETTLTPDQVFELFRNVLEMNGLVITQVGDFYKIIETKKAQKRYLEGELGTSAGNDDRIVTQVVKLRYVEAEKVKAALAKFLPDGTDMNVYDDTLIITDRAANVKKILAIIEQIDVGKYFDIFPIKYAKLSELVDELNQILALNDLTGSSTPSVATTTTSPASATDQTAGAPTAAATPPAAATAAGTSLVPPGTRTRVYGIKRLNALAVSTNQPEVLDLVRKWVEALDRQASDFDQDQVERYFYSVKYGEADNLASRLAEIYLNQPAAASPETSPNQDAATPPTTTVAPPAETSTTLANETAPKFIADKATNSVVIKATPAQYNDIRELLKDLDGRPLQVLIDVIIAEVQLNDTDVFGVQGMGIGQGQLSTGGETNSFETTTQTTFADVMPTNAQGFSFVGAAPGRLLMQLRALATENRLKVLSDPHILVRHNEKATINVGDEIPISKTTGTGDTAQKSVEYRQTGIILEVEPRINQEGEVVMNITQEVTDVGQESFGDTGSPSLTTRKTTTSVVTKDNYPLIIGGLIGSRAVESQQGVPLLKDLPLFGRLFRYNEEQNRRVELLILVTPRVVQDPNGGWNLTDDMLDDRIEQLQQFFNRQETDTDRMKRYLKKPFKPFKKE